MIVHVEAGDLLARRSDRTLDLVVGSLAVWRAVWLLVCVRGDGLGWSRVCGLACWRGGLAGGLGGWLSGWWGWLGCLAGQGPDYRPIGW